MASIDNFMRALAGFGAGVQGRGQEYLRGLATDDLGQKFASGEIDQNQYLMGLAQNDPTVARQVALQKAGIGRPSAIQEWEYFNNLPEDQQKQFLGVKRAQQVVNLGGTQAVLDPTGGIKESYDVTLKPGEAPQIREEQARSAALGTGRGGMQIEQEKKSRQAVNTLSLVDEAQDLLPQSTSGLTELGAKGIQQAVGVSTDSSKADAKLKVISAGLVSNVPRMEGPQSDRDVRMYREAAGNIADSKIPYEDRIAALETIKTLQSKYAQPNAAPAPTGAKRFNFNSYKSNFGK